MKKLNIEFIIMLLAVSFLMFSCNKNEKEKQLSENTVTETIESKPSEKIQSKNQNVEKTKPISKSTATKTVEAKPKQKEIKVTFIELGSVGCIPCKMMQPIMKEIEEEYADQVKVIFYDVWTEQGRPYAQKYRIRVIPTQVFLDKDGNEYFRHEGFFPKEELVKVLKMKGVQ